MVKPGQKASHDHTGTSQQLSAPATTPTQSLQGNPSQRRHEHEQRALLHQQRQQARDGCADGLGPAATPQRIPPTPQPPERQGDQRGERQLQHVITAQIQEGGGDRHQTSSQQGKPTGLTPWVAQRQGPSGHHQQQQAMPKAEAPGRLDRCITGQRHHGAVHQGCQWRDLRGEIEKGLPTLPTTPLNQAEGTAMVEGTVEVIGLVPSGNAIEGMPPPTVHNGGQQPDQQQRKTKAPSSHQAISNRRRSCCSR